MLKRLALPVVLVWLLCPSVSWSEAPAPAPAPSGDTLSDDEGATLCAEALPKQLACKEDFCAAMAQMRARGDKKVDLERMKAKCQQEIAVEGTGDLATRKNRCAGWIKSRPKMSLTRTQAQEMAACWSKPTCKDQVDCWSPKMAKMMESAAPKKK